VTYNYCENHPKEFLAAFNSLASSKNASVDTIKTEVYFKALHDLPIEAVRQASDALIREPSPYLPDAGTWYDRADRIACQMYNVDAQKSLPPSKDVKRDEREYLITAREEFLQKLEAILGRPVSEKSAWRKPVEDIVLPTYVCLSCHDTGWVRQQKSMEEVRLYGPKGGQPTVKTCGCTTTNAVIKARYAAYDARTREPVKRGGRV